MRDQATVTSILQHLAMPGRQDITEHSNFPISKTNKQHDFHVINNGRTNNWNFICTIMINPGGAWNGDLQVLCGPDLRTGERPPGEIRPFHSSIAFRFSNQHQYK
jgi:hypothetical protein